MPKICWSCKTALANGTVHVCPNTDCGVSKSDPANKHKSHNGRSVWPEADACACHTCANTALGGVRQGAGGGGQGADPGGVPDMEDLRSLFEKSMANAAKNASAQAMATLTTQIVQGFDKWLHNNFALGGEALDVDNEFMASVVSQYVHEVCPDPFPDPFRNVYACRILKSLRDAAADAHKADEDGGDHALQQAYLQENVKNKLDKPLTENDLEQAEWVLREYLSPATDTRQRNAMEIGQCICTAIRGGRWPPHPALGKALRLVVGSAGSPQADIATLRARNVYAGLVGLGGSPFQHPPGMHAGGRGGAAGNSGNPGGYRPRNRN
eukprot:gene5367-5390_t